MEKEEDAAWALKVFAADLDGRAHDRMAADGPRVGAYARAISRAVKGRVVLDLGTGPRALLALLCARAGAARVVALEVVPAVAALARRAVAEAGFSDRIEVVVGYSTLVPLPRVDLVVHEIVGNLATEEGLASVLADLQGRPEVVDSARPGWSLPRCVETWAAPVSLSVALPPGGEPLPPSVLRLPCPPPPATLLGEPRLLETVDAERPIALRQARRLRWVVKAAGRLGGFACAPRVAFDQYEALDAWAAATHWRHLLVPLAAPVRVLPGDAVELAALADLRRLPVRHAFTAAVVRAPRGPRRVPRREPLGRIEAQLR